MTKYRKVSTGAALITMATLIMGLLGPLPLAVKEAYACHCELELTKIDSADPVSPGDELIYYLTLENIGSADCTGSGVRIMDVFDQNTEYVSSSKTPESITSEYIKWNFGTLYPGDTKNVNLTMLVSEETECGSILINKAKFWSNQTSWGDYVIEETTVECPPEPYCGDGNLDPGEECEVGHECCGEHYTCNLQTCLCEYVPYCGDGNVDQGEECDDSNNEDGDGCSAVCTIETPGPYCGDGNVDKGEECEVGHECCGEHYTCNLQTCLCEYVPYCGDGNVDEGEECDDGNNEDGDGCSANCTEEPECTTDDDCDTMDDDYCEGTLIKHDEGRCIEFECTTETTTVMDCDDDLYCNGQEGCSNANCVAGTAVDCSENDLSEIATCEYDPDNNPFTWDFFIGFTSTCNECADTCTTGTINLTHTCDIEVCGAECEEDEDCEEGGYCNSLCACEYEEDEPCCGDGNLDQGEECDDGNLDNGDGCSSTCTIEDTPPEPYCGDGIINGEEECDDGPEGSETCTSECVIIEEEPYCGDGNVDEGEECDNGGQNGQACSPGCESSCTYCSTECIIIELTGGSCGRGGNGGGGGSTPNPPKRPTLIIDKSIAEEFANPGSLITYTIVVTNTGPGVAYNAILDDNLPSGFSYDNPATIGEWDLGKLKKGDSETITFLARVGDGVAVGTYINSAETEADNHSPVSDDAAIEIRIPVVLGEMTELTEFAELPDTGATTLMSILWIIAVITFISSTTALIKVVPKDINLSNRNKKSFGNFAY